MSTVRLPLKNKNALKQQVIATSLGKVLVCKKDEQFLSVARQINHQTASTIKLQVNQTQQFLDIV